MGLWHSSTAHTFVESSGTNPSCFSSAFDVVLFDAILYRVRCVQESPFSSLTSRLRWFCTDVHVIDTKETKMNVSNCRKPKRWTRAPTNAASSVFAIVHASHTSQASQASQLISPAPCRTTSTPSPVRSSTVLPSTGSPWCRTSSSWTPTTNPRAGP